MGSEPEPYWRRIRRLRDDQDLTEDALLRRAPEGLSRSTIQALQRPYRNGKGGQKSPARYPSSVTLERMAEALEVSPAAFPEYRLARARELLDERTRGLDPALETLTELIAGLGALAAEMAARGEEPPSALRLLRRAIGDEP